MYQLRATCGLEIQVLQSGEHGACRIVDSIGEIRFRGEYDECIRWLEHRGIYLL